MSVLFPLSSGSTEPGPSINRKICKPMPLPLSQVPRTYPSQFPTHPKWYTSKLTSQLNMCPCLFGFIKSGFSQSVFTGLQLKSTSLWGLRGCYEESEVLGKEPGFLPQLSWKKTPPKGTTREHFPELGGERETVFLFTNYNELCATVFNGNHVR